MSNVPDSVVLARFENVDRKLEELTGLTVSIARSEERTNNLLAQQLRMESKVDKITETLYGDNGMMVKQTRLIVIVSGAAVIGGSVAGALIRLYLGA